MAVTEQELNEALNRAALLMSNEGQRRIDIARKQNVNNFDNDGVFIAPSGMANNLRMQQPTQQPRMNSNSKLPKVIQESMVQHPIDNTMNEYSNGGSVLDAIGYKPTQNIVQEQQYTVPLQPQMQAPTYYQQPMMNIDYNYIKAIVNECIQANLQQIKEELIKENTLKTIRVGGENKIQLIDNKNNLYESKLEFKRNLTKK